MGKLLCNIVNSCYSRETENLKKLEAKKIQQIVVLKEKPPPKRGINIKMYF